MSYIKPMFQFVLFIILALGFAGICIAMSSFNPLKKEVVLMSPLEGTLFNNGQILANVDIEVVIVMPGGAEKTFKHNTDDKGYFSLPVIKDQMTLGPMTEFVVSQFIDVFYNGEKHTIWSAAKREPGLYEERDPPKKAINITCDITDNSIESRQGAGFIETKCKWSELINF
ncbi:DUF6795 domain-containing protein [Agaribacterium sp. ZY112]|uniref:DUF6795 domain-containing protein n=1 Tax=Agaribacterium sp. ZY112 TaxID=3233574 RepID=UPI0035263506